MAVIDVVQMVALQGLLKPVSYKNFNAALAQARIRAKWDAWLPVMAAVGATAMIATAYIVLRNRRSR